MKIVYWLFCCAALGGCMHSAPAQVKKEPAPAPVAATPQVKPELSAALVEKAIVKGKTTKKELLALIGTPIAVEKNNQQLPRDLLETIKVPLPPIARTKEFWKYRSNPFTREGSMQSRIYSVMVFFDDNDVAVDYVTAENEIAPP